MGGATFRRSKRQSKDNKACNAMLSKLMAAHTGKQYHAVGNYHLKDFWECSMQTIMHNSFTVENQNILGKFLLFVGQDQLGENYLTYSRVWGVPEYIMFKCITFSGYSSPSRLQKNHVCENSVS